MNSSDPIGIYIHVPFCTGKCPYCDFYSVCGSDSALRDRYTDAVLTALSYYAERLDRRADTLYFGGGTPVLLGERLARVIKQCADNFVLENAEITVEANPESVSAELAGILAEAGVNRVSLGVQSSDPEELAVLGRRHGADESARAAEMILAEGIENLSADMMLGIPAQTDESAMRTAEFCAEIGVRHISAYMLGVEPETPFGRRELTLPDDDSAADIYEAVCGAAERLGFRQYEISNFARPGYESRHNLKYWRCEEYLGIGPAAHSFLEGRRFFAPRDLEGFCADPVFCVDDGPGGGFEETVMLGLRLACGIDLGELARRFSEREAETLRSRAHPFAERGFCRLEGETLALTRRGFLVSNAILAELLK